MDEVSRESVCDFERARLDWPCLVFSAPIRWWLHVDHGQKREPAKGKRRVDKGPLQKTEFHHSLGTKHLGEVFHKLAAQKESKIEEGHLMPDHVHMMISIPPKYAVSQVIEFIKGQKHGPSGASLRGTQTQFRGPAFLGARVFCEHGGF